MPPDSCISSPTSASIATPTITICNLCDGDVLTYPLAILAGTITPHHPEIHVSTSTPTVPYSSYPVVSTLFRALYHLNPGANRIYLSSTPSTLSTSPALTITLIYTPPPPSVPFIRLVYLLAADSNGSFQSPDPPPHNDIASATKRLQTAGWMIQSATAEMMYAQGFGRRTFTLAPKVHIYKLTNLTVRDAHKMPGLELWSHTVQELRKLPRREDSIDVAVISFTAMDGGKVRGHTALGGERLALFGGGCMFTWPEGIWEIGRRLRDCRKLDSRKFFDDSAGRAAEMGRRACAATTIGALLHELGHCLSLPHPTRGASKGGRGIMARSFDYLDRLFVQSGLEEELPFWDRGSAVRLRYHQFLRLEGEAEMNRLRNIRVEEGNGQGNKEKELKFVREGGAVICRSSSGIGHVGYYKNGDNASHEEFKEGEEPTEFRLPRVEEIHAKCGMSATDKLVVSAIDVDGRIVNRAYDEI